MNLTNRSQYKIRNTKFATQTSSKATIVLNLASRGSFSVSIIIKILTRYLVEIITKGLLFLVHSPIEQRVLWENNKQHRDIIYI